MRGSAEPEEGIPVTLSTDKHVYEQGQPIQVAFELINLSSRPFGLAFATAQHFDLLMTDLADQEVWRWSRRRAFATKKGQESLRLGKPSLNYDFEIAADLPPGRYRLQAYLMDSQQSATASLVIAIEENAE